MADLVFEDKYTLERLSPIVWKVVENDPYGQFPFFYAIEGEDKFVLVDTGCGTGNLRQFLEKHVNTGKKPWLVICTHVHFDHCGGNYHFSGENHDGVIDICFADVDRRFTENYELTSLSMGQGMTLRPFTITRWLHDGESLYLSDRNQDADQELRILHIPGHCIDHLAVWFGREKRLFVGDTVYPFTALVVSALGANLPDYIQSLQRLRDHAAAMRSQEHEVATATGAETATATTGAETDTRGAAAPTGTAGAASSGGGGGAAQSVAEEATLETREALARSMVEDILGLDWDTASANFDPVRLLELSDGNMDDAVNLFVSCGESVGQIAPPRSQAGASRKPPSSADRESSAEPGAGRRLPVPPLPSTVTLACGHVDPALEAVPALDELLDFLEMIRAKAVEPGRIDYEDESVEYAQQRFAVVLPRDARWEST